MTHDTGARSPERDDASAALHRRRGRAGRRSAVIVGCSTFSSARATARPRRRPTSSSRSSTDAGLDRAARASDRARAGRRRRRRLRRPDQRAEPGDAVRHADQRRGGPGPAAGHRRQRGRAGPAGDHRGLLPGASSTEFEEFVDSLKTADVGEDERRWTCATASRDLMAGPATDLAELVAMRSVADPRQFPPEECARAAQWVLDRFAEARLRRRRGSSDARRQPGRVRLAARRRPGRARPCCCTPTTTCSRRSTTSAWRTPPFELTEVDGRWYGRGAADCKGNIVMHLTALRALGDDIPVNLKLVVEGSEEQGTGGLEAFVAATRRPAARRRDPGLRHRQRRGRRAGGDRQPARHGQRRGHRRGARAPRCTPACSAAPPRTRWPRSIRMLATLRDERRQHHDRGPGQHPDLGRRALPARAVPRRRRACSTASTLLGDGTVADMLWARPAVTVLGIDCPPVVGLGGRDRAADRGPAQPAGPARHGRRPTAQTRWSPTSRPRRPWGVHVDVEPEAIGSPFQARDRRAGLRSASARAMQEAYGTADGHARARAARSRCATCSPTPIPDAEIILHGRGGAAGLIHAPNESVDPTEIEAMALSEALFLQRYAAA